MEVLPYVFTGGLAALIASLCTLYLLNPKKRLLTAEAESEEYAAEKAQAESSDAITDSLEKLVKRCGHLALQIVESDTRHQEEIVRIKRSCADEIRELVRNYDIDVVALKKEVRDLTAEVTEFRKQFSK